MKKFRKFAALMLAAALVALLPGVSSLKAFAASPTTYFVFLDGDKWYYQIGTSEFNPDDKQYEAELILTKSDVTHPQDGDIIVVGTVNQSGGAVGYTLDLSGIRLSNVTVTHSTSIVVKAASIDKCYVLSDSTAAINGDVTDAYVYDRSHVNFNNNVSNLYISSDTKDDAPEINVMGTVGYATYTLPGELQFQYYNFIKGAFEFNDSGKIKSNVNYYQSEGNGPVSATPAQSSASEQQTAASNQAPASSGSNASSSEYDDVPKTGEAFPVYVWFLCAAAICYACKKAIETT